nr:MAG TPA: hypothetical protein [Caudoviricetes sp.]
MDWKAFFADLEKWMQASNVMVQRYGGLNENYFEWLVQTLNVIYERYPSTLARRFLFDIMEAQEEQLKEVVK